MLPGRSSASSPSACSSTSARPTIEQFFDALARLMTDDGVALLHSIGRMDEPGSSSAWFDKYIFPGGYAPEFYLTASEMAFRHDGLMVFQIQLAKRVETVPITRDYIYRRAGAAEARSARARPLHALERVVEPAFGQAAD